MLIGASRRDSASRFHVSIWNDTEAALRVALVLIAGVVGCGKSTEQVDDAQIEPAAGKTDNGNRGSVTRPKYVPVINKTDRKVALFIGVNQYDKRGFAGRPLKFAERDVDELAKEFTKHGFKVQLLKGSLEGRKRATKANILAAVDALLSDRKADDLVLIGLAGHGQQLPLLDEDGRPKTDDSGKELDDAYFCPVDAEQGNPGSLVSLTKLLGSLDRRGGVNLVMVDACRDAPEAGRGVRAMSGNELNGRLPANTAIVFSCAAGQQAFETIDAGGGHGVFFHEVLEGMRGKAQDAESGEITWGDLVSHVRKYVPRRAKELFSRPAEDSGGVDLQTPHQLTNLVARPVLAKFAVPAAIRPESVPNTAPTVAKPVPADPRPRPSQESPEFTNSIGMKLVLIQPGEFLMGSPASEKDRSDDEHQHRVRITKPYYLATTEVTQKQWESVMGTTPWKGEKYVKEGPDFAATYVSWEDAQEFCRKLSAKEGVTYRLPTEAEWEYACRAGSTTRYSFGDEDSRLSDYAWWGGILGDGNSKGEKYAHEVGRKLPNAFGLYDMHGNDWEWCSDLFAEDYYMNSPAIDPKGPGAGHVRYTSAISLGAQQPVVVVRVV